MNRTSAPQLHKMKSTVSAIFPFNKGEIQGLHIIYAHHEMSFSNRQILNIVGFTSNSSLYPAYLVILSCLPFFQSCLPYFFILPTMSLYPAYLVFVSCHPCLTILPSLSSNPAYLVFLPCLPYLCMLHTFLAYLPTLSLYPTYLAISTCPPCHFILRTLSFASAYLDFFSAYLVFLSFLFVSGSGSRQLCLARQVLT